MIFLSGKEEVGVYKSWSSQILFEVDETFRMKELQPPTCPKVVRHRPY